MAATTGENEGTIKSALSRYRREVANLNATPPEGNATSEPSTNEPATPELQTPESNATANATASPTTRPEIPAREKILTYLETGGAWTIPEIAERLRLPQKTVQKSIQRMPGGVVETFRKGKVVLFRMDARGAFSMGRRWSAN